MGAFRYVPAHEVATRHRMAKSSARGPRPTATEAPSVLRNIKPILTLGAVRYFEFRGHAYAVPPVPYQFGQKLLDVYTRCLGCAKVMADAKTATPTVQSAYYDALSLLRKMMWRHAHRAGWGWRLLKRVHLDGNAFQRATEKELLEMADFFLKGRMTSHVQFSPESAQEE